MNLIADPWIPAVLSDGRSDLFSLNELFNQAHELRDLAVKPHERIALMRLLICITQAALDGPKDEQAWEECESSIQLRVRNYLKNWQTGFELFGAGPRFLQTKPGVIALAEPVMQKEGITRLNLCLASGESNATLFDHAGSDDREFSTAQASIGLLTYQCYSPLLGRGYKGRSPCADNSMLHAFLIGSTLLKTIHLNLLPHTTIEDAYAPHGIGRPIWEVSLTETPSRDTQQMLTQSYLGRLVPIARSIWLESTSTMILANGLTYAGFLDSGYREPSSTILSAKSKNYLLKAKPDRAIWRELQAVCVKNAHSDGVSGPLAFRNPFPNSDHVVWVGALITDKAKIEDTVEGCYALPEGMLTEFGRVAYEQGVQHAEERESDLIQAVKSYSTTLKIVPPASDRARQRFWTRVEQHVSDLFEVARKLTPKEALPECPWGQAVKQAALDAYEWSSPRQTPRQIQAYALGLGKFNSKTSKSNKKQL